MANARTALALDLDQTPGLHRLMGGLGAAQPWHGFRLAAVNGEVIGVDAERQPQAAASRLAAVGVPHIDPLAVVDAIDEAITDVFTTEFDGSLAWVGQLACWLTALLSLSLIALAIV